MTDRQQQLTEYCAGLFDGDGSISPGVRRDRSWPDHGYNVAPECTLTNRYVAGLFDAEGCVKPVVAQRDNSAVDYHIDPESRITNADETLIGQLTEFADAIGVEYSVYHNENADSNRDSTFQFDVRQVQNIRRFLENLKPYLVAKKQQANIMLDDILPLLAAGEHGRKRGFLKIMYHVDRLNSLKGGNRGKYNLEYFEDEWGMTYDP